MFQIDKLSFGDTDHRRSLEMQVSRLVLVLLLEDVDRFRPDMLTKGAMEAVTEAAGHAGHGCHGNHHGGGGTCWPWVPWKPSRRRRDMLAMGAREAVTEAAGHAGHIAREAVTEAAGRVGHRCQGSRHGGGGTYWP